MKKILTEILKEQKETKKILLAIKNNQEQNFDINLDGRTLSSIINNHSKETNHRSLS